MRRQIFFGTVLSAALAVGVSAQSGTAQSDRMSGGKTVTVTGCLQSGSASSPAGTTGTTPSPSTSPSTAAGASGGEYVLMNAQPSASASTTTSTAGTTGSTTAPSSWASGLKLSGSTEDLSKLVNHKVEIKGSIDESASSSTSPSPSTMSSAKPTLKVTSVRDIADSCSASQK